MTEQLPEGHYPRPDIAERRQRKDVEDELARVREELERVKGELDQQSGQAALNAEQATEYVEKWDWERTAREQAEAKLAEERGKAFRAHVRAERAEAALLERGGK